MNDNIFFQRLTKGDFFNENNRENLNIATFAMQDFSPKVLVNALTEHFPDYSASQQVECLVFIMHYLRLTEVKNSLFNTITLFCESVAKSINDPSLAPLINEISEILLERVHDQKQKIAKELKALSKGKFSASTCLRWVNTLISDLDSADVADMDEIVQITEAILDSPNLFSTDNPKLNLSLQKAFETFCERLDKFPAYQAKADSLRIKLTENINEPPVKKLPKVSTEPKDSLFPKILMALGNEEHHLQEYEKLLEDFIMSIERSLYDPLSQIELSEIENFTFQEENKRIAKGLLPKSPHIRKYFQAHRMMTQFISLIILYDLDPFLNLKPRESIYAVKRLLQFMEKAALMAKEKGAQNTFLSLRAALSNPDIRELSPSTIEEAEEGKKGGTPDLRSLLTALRAEYNKEHQDEFQRRIQIGKKIKLIFTHIQSAKEGANRDLIPYLSQIMHQNHLVLDDIIQDDIRIDNDRVTSLISHAREYIKPKTFKTHEINEFKTITDLKDYLLYCYNRGEDFHLEDKKPEKAIIEFLSQTLSNDVNLGAFNEFLQIIELVKNINLAQSKKYTNYESDLTEILSFFRNRVKSLMKETPEQSDQLDHFFSSYAKNPQINHFRDNVDTFNPLSSIHRLKEMISDIDKLQDQHKKHVEMAQKTQTQQTYTALLDKILEGEGNEPIIRFGAGSHKKRVSRASLLPDTEYPVPRAEPEHPSNIGINRTMSFNPKTGERSLFELFSTKDLKKDFLNAFPWSLDINKIKKIEVAKHQPAHNLLLSNQFLPQDLQLATIEFLLLSLDLLGKIAGIEGEFAISNFATIKMITDSLHQVSVAAEKIPFESDRYKAELKILTDKFSDLNEDLIKQKERNDMMNEFCYINLILSHRLLGIPLEKRILSPINPHSPLLEKVSDTIKRELLQGNSPKMS